MSEASQSTCVLEDISATQIQGAAVVKVAFTEAADKLHKMEGLRSDKEVATILSVTWEGFIESLLQSKEVLAECQSP